MSGEGEVPPVAPHFRQLIDQAPVLIRHSGPQGNCLFVNERWQAFTGIDATAALGDGWLAAVHPDDRAGYQETFGSHYQLQRAFEVEYRCRDRKGDYRWLLEQAAPVRGTGGELDGFVSYGFDIDARKAAEGARAVAMSMVAHEQRTPLMASRLMIELSRRRHAAGLPTDDALLDKLLLQHHRLNRLVADLSETARQELALPLTINRAQVELKTLLSDTVELQRLRLVEQGHPARQHHLTLTLPDGPLLASGDADRLAQVVANLLDNAVKYSPEGGDIAVVATAGDRHHRITVRDTGIGIEPAEIPLLPQRFYRGSNAPAEYFPGVGLGLAICDAIIGAHGGTLKIDSAPAHGTAVTFTVPVA